VTWKWHPELADDMVPEFGRLVESGLVQDARARRASPLELHLAHDGHVHRERGHVHERQRQRFPLRGERAAHGEKTGRARLEHPFVDPEGDKGLCPARRSAIGPSTMAASDFDPSSPAATVQLMIKVLTIGPSHPASRSHSHHRSSGSAVSAAPLGR
jgi:hypothetical protein